MANADSIEQQSSAAPQSCDSFNLPSLWYFTGGVVTTIAMSTINLDPAALPFANGNTTDLSRPLITIGSPANAQLLPGDRYCDFKYQPFDYTYCLNNYRDPKRINRSNVAELVRWAEQYNNRPAIKRILVHYIEMQNKSNFGDVGAIGNSEDLYSFVTRPALWRSIPQQDLAEARKVFHQIASEFAKNVIFQRFPAQYPDDVGNYSRTLFTYLNSQTVLGIEMSYENYLNNDNQQTAIYRKYMARMQEVDRHKLNHWKQYYSRLVNRFRKEKDLAFLTDMMTNLQNTIVPWKSGHFQFLPNMHVRSDLMFTDLTSPSLTSFDYNVNRQLVEQRNAKYKEYFFAEILPDVLEELESAIIDLEAQGVRYYDNPYALLTGIVALAIDIAPTRGASRLANIGKRGGHSGRIINQADDIATSGRNKPNRGRTNTTEGVPCVADLDTSKIAEGFDAREWIVASIGLLRQNDLGELLAGRTCLEVFNQINNNALGQSSINKALRYYNNLRNLKVQRRILDSGGRSGNLSKNFRGEPNSIYRTNSADRIIVTDEVGRSMLDITRNRVKIYADFKTPDGRIVRRDLKLPDFENGTPTIYEYQTSQPVIDFINQINSK